MPAIVKLQDIRALIDDARVKPAGALSALRDLAASDNWRTREVAATALVEISKRHAEFVLELASDWAIDADPNLRRAASEGLRGLVKIAPLTVRPVLDALRRDPHLYVKKSVANVLRNASTRHPEFVLALCRDWAASPNPHTRWIVNDGLRKLKTAWPERVGDILSLWSAPPAR